VLQAQATGQHHGQVTGRRGHLLTVLGAVKYQAKALLPTSALCSNPGALLGGWRWSWRPSAVIDLSVKMRSGWATPEAACLPWLQWWQGTSGLVVPPPHWSPVPLHWQGLAPRPGGVPLGLSSVARWCLRAARGGRPWSTPVGVKASQGTLGPRLMTKRALHYG
jgi:hypothetical protein